MTHRFDHRSNTWRMKVPLNRTEIREKLEEIPGLRFLYNENEVYGLVDAIAAACWRMGVQAPALDSGAAHVTTPLSIATDKYILKDYQVFGVAKLYEILLANGSAILADDLGLGKTLQTIALANQLPQPSRNLVVVPRFLAMNWADELTKWGEPDFQIISVGLNNKAITKKERAVWGAAKTSKWVITSFDMMEEVFSNCFSDSPPDFVIFDEAHLLKNTKTKRAQKALEAATLATFRLAITGTPMDNRPKDFYGLLRVLFGTHFGSRTAFYNAYCGGRINEHGGLEATGLTNQEELKRRLGYYMVRREKADVLRELPALQRQVMWLPPDPMGEKALKAAVLNKRKDATYLAVRATAEAKMQAAINLANQAKRFFLVTYERKHAEQIASALDLLGTPNVVIHGGMSVPERHKRIKAATTNGWGICATLDSTKGGLNLQGVAHIGIFHVLDWQPLKMAQVEARIHRIGQKEQVIWYYLACKESMDELVVRTVVSKLDQWRALLGSDSNRSLRDDLSGDIGGGPSEAEAMRALYEAM